MIIAAAENADPSPTIDQVVNGGFAWLEIQIARKALSGVDFVVIDARREKITVLQSKLGLVPPSMTNRSGKPHGTPSLRCCAAMRWRPLQVSST